MDAFLKKFFSECPPAGLVLRPDQDSVVAVGVFELRLSGICYLLLSALIGSAVVCGVGTGVGMLLCKPHCFPLCLVTSLFASSVTETFGHRPSILVGGAAYLAGACFAGAASNVFMLILGRVMLGVGVGFLTQVCYPSRTILFARPSLEHIASIIAGKRHESEWH
ncbi:Sugar transport protein 3 [Camellia lanceoleosa]|uniref:Sugar transport protein 3 n=1 Tax=Camellia lanceoleosa TaxID=1840588 RepID=A0ACC0IUU5_9ERIC|nr:Sugar transport protein 3 [Camellia lanceoleosa]